MAAHAIRIIHVTSDFEKSFRKLPTFIQDLAQKKDRWFRADAFDTRPERTNSKENWKVTGLTPLTSSTECSSVSWEVIQPSTTTSVPTKSTVSYHSARCEFRGGGKPRVKRAGRIEPTRDAAGCGVRGERSGVESVERLGHSASTDRFA